MKRHIEKAILWIAATLTAGAFLAVAFVRTEDQFFGSSPSEVEVSVVAVEGTVHNDGGLPAFRYRVRLPDRRESVLLSARLYKPGTRVVVMESVGMITGLLQLSGPERVVSSADKP